MIETENQRRETDEQIDKILKPWPRAEKEFHNVPIAAQIAAERDKTPVESADDHENECDTMQFFHEDE